MMTKSGRAAVAVTAVGALVLGTLGVLPASAAPPDFTYTSPSRSFSPDGDGFEDEFDATFRLADAANVTITVEDDGGNVVSTLQNGQSTPRNQYTYLEWDGRTEAGDLAPDGSYAVVIDAVNVEAATQARIDTVVDTRVPGAITMPEPGVEVSGTVDVVFTAGSDLPLDDVYLSVGSCWSDRLEPDLSGSTTWQVDVAECGSGDAEVSGSVYWRDTFGQQHSYSPEPVSVVLATAPRLQERYGARQTVTLTSPGQVSDLGWSLRCNHSGATDLPVTAEILDSSGSVVRTLQDDQVCYGSSVATDVYFSWVDALDEAGTQVPDGDYTFRAEVTNSYGTSTYDTPIVVDTRVPGAITMPEPGVEVSGTVDVVFTAGSDLPLDDVYLSVGSCWSDRLEPDLSGSTTWQVDVAECGSGDAEVSGSVYWRDTFGQQHSYSPEPVSVVLATAPRLQERYGARQTVTLTSPGQVSDLGWSLRCNHSGATDLPVTAEILDSSGSVVRTLQDDQVCYGSSVATDVYFSWVDALDEAGTQVPDGDYTFRAEVTNSYGTSTYDTPIVVDTRVPGAITMPEPGVEVSGTVDVVFTAGSDLPLDDVYLSVGSCWSDRLEPDLSGSTTWQVDVAECGSGDAEVSGSVYWRDTFGQQHSYSPEPVSVVLATAPRLQERYGARQTVTLTSPGQVSDLGWSLRCNHSGATDLPVTAEILDSSGSVVRTLQDDQVCYGSSVATDVYFSWVDALDEAGTQVPDGDYTFRAEVTNSYGTSTYDTPIVVDTRVPGAITTPEPGGVLAGFAPVVFQPTAGFEGVESVDLYLVDTGFGIYNVSEDGAWRTAYPIGGFPAGAADMQWQVQWLDTFGQRHYYYADPIEVAIDPEAVPLDVRVDPTEGEAPLEVALSIEASDGLARPLDITIRWGDGTEESLVMEAPYPTAELAHTFGDPGTYQVFVSVTNGEGGYNSATVPVVASGLANTAPALDLTLASVTGTAPMVVAPELAATDDEGDDLTYRVDFGDGSDSTGDYPADPAIEHTYEQPGVYLLRAEVSDGQLTTARAQRITVVLPEELVAEAGDNQTVVVGNKVHFSAEGSRPAALISSYEWDFGDGSSDSGSSVEHSFKDPGTYTAEVTVRAGDESATDETTVTVLSEPVEPGLRVNVTGGGSLLAGAEVTVVLPDGNRVTARTGSDGQAVLHGLVDGAYTAFVWAGGFKPATVQASVVDGAGDLDVALASGEVGAATLEHRRLTIAEIEERGIDTSDPANQFVYEAEINLFFVPECPPGEDCEPEPPKDNDLLFTYNGEGQIIAIVSAIPGVPGPTGCDVTDPTVGCFLLGGHYFYPSVQYVEDQPILQWLVIPVKATWLKEFFDVTLIVQNLTEGFTFTEGSATLDLPAGLSLAPTAGAQAAVVSVPDVAGGESYHQSWTVRGDDEGEYNLSAAYTGLIEPIGKPVRLDARSSQPLKVWGGSALKMIVEADEHAVRWAPYAIDVTLQNLTADVSVYNASVELKDRPEDAPDWQAPYVFAPLTQMVQSTPVIPPGESFTGRWIVYPGLGNDEVRFLELVEEMSFVRRTGGNVDIATEVRSRENDPSVNQALDVNVTVDKKGDDRAVADWAVPSVDGKQVAGYQVFTKQTLDSTSAWQPYSEATITTAEAKLAIPASLRGKGRYLGILTHFEDGSSMLAHRLGEGPARYVSLGDSYSSGEGVPSFEPATDTSNNECHRSNGSYARLVTARGGALEDLQPAGYHACSGAVTRDIETVDADLLGQPKNVDEPAQRDHVSEFTDLITLTMGGNDIAFSDIVQNCVIGDCRWSVIDALVAPELWEAKEALETAAACAAPETTISKLKCAYGIYSAAKRSTADDERRATPYNLGWYGPDILQRRLARVYTALASDAPNARIVIMKYPRLTTTSDADHEDFCRIARFEFEALSTGLLSGPERQFVNHIVDELNRAIDSAAAAAQQTARANGSSAVFQTVDPNPAFAGNELCKGGDLAPPVAFNALEDPLTSGRPIAYSYHPNADGQALYAQALTQALGGLSTRVALHPDEVVTVGTVDVSNDAARLVVSETHPGSEVGLEVVSPTGVRYDRDTEGVEYRQSDTTATLEVLSPVAGTWSVDVLGVDVAEDGEETQVRAWSVGELRASPDIEAAVASVAGSATAFRFSVDVTDESDATATWRFSDGTVENGQNVEHDFEDAPTPWQAFLTVAGPDGTSTATIVTAQEPPPPPAAANVVASQEGDKATVSWTPGDPNGVDILGYVAIATPGGARCETTTDQACVIEGLAPEIEYTFSVVTVGGNGGSASSDDASPSDDSTAPTINVSVEGTQGETGWYISDVLVSWSVQDAESAVASVEGCDSVAVNEDTDGLTLTCEATSSGGIASESVTIKRDATPPVVSGSTDREPNGAGWFDDAVTVSWTAEDALTGPLRVPDPTLVDEGVDQTAVSGEVCDAAGNCATGELSRLNVDVTAPTLTGKASEEPNDAGWYSDDVTVTWECADELSGIPDGTCPADVLLTGEGDAVAATAQVSDVAGNATSVSSEQQRIDRTPPATLASAQDGGSDGSVEILLSATDNLSGVATTFVAVDGADPVESDAVTVSGRGSHLVSFWSVDVAGNIETASEVKVLIDESGPVVTHQVTPAANDAGWHNTAPTVSWKCEDSDAGIEVCPDPVTVLEDGPGQVVTGEAFDRVGNRTVDSVTVNLDRQAPSVEPVLSAEPNEAGWLNAPVVVSWVCSDAMSGVAECPDPVTMDEGAAQSVAGVAVDMAGNETSVTVGNLSVDATAPIVTCPIPEPVYVAGAEANLEAAVSDGLSGVAAQAGSVPVDTLTAGPGSVEVSVADLAGNVSTVQCGYEVWMYRARNGDPDRKEKPERIYLERHVQTAGVGDWDPDGDGWALVGRTNGAGDNGKLARFWMGEDGLPYAATRHHKEGCLTLTPKRLDVVKKGQARTMVRERNTSDCRAEPAGADVDGDGVPDDEQDLYRVADDGKRLHLERSTVAAEAQLGVSDWDPDGDGWSDYARTNGSSGYGVLDRIHAGPQGEVSVWVEHNKKGCQVLVPRRTDTVGKGQTRRLVVSHVLGGTCPGG